MLQKIIFTLVTLTMGVAFAYNPEDPNLMMLDGAKVQVRTESDTQPLDERFHDIAEITGELGVALPYTSAKKVEPRDPTLHEDTAAPVTDTLEQTSADGVR